ncbi:hypothetical protein RCL1_006151 [Eukaryota sp. TZLM3-RCL]
MSSNWSKFLSTQTQPQRKRRSGSSNSAKKVNTNESPSDPSLPIRLTRCLALDCEMVGVGQGGHRSALAHVVIVNEFMEPVYSYHVLPKEHITDYRTQWSGVTEKDLTNAISFEQCQQQVAEIIKDRIIVGHDVAHDFRSLGLSHPRHLIRDTSKFKFFKKAFNGATPKLKMLAGRFLGKRIQTGEHDPKEDAVAALELYLKFKNQWEASLKTK